MAFLTPDSIRTEHGLEIKQRIIPNGATVNGRKIKSGALLSGGTGIAQYVTIHNTDLINAAAGSTMAEQYSRATYPNGNMKDVVVHYYIDHEDCWQNLSENEIGWHSGDGSGPGNGTSIAIEIIMSGKGTEQDNRARERGALLASILLARHGLGIDRLATHNQWASKYCPLYILPTWSTFVETVKQYMAAINGGEQPAVEVPAVPEEPADEYLRVQVGAYAQRPNMETMKAKLQADGYKTYMVYSGGLYKVQVGAFTVPANATALMNELKAKGYEAFITGTPAGSIEEETTTIAAGSRVKVKSGAKDYAGGKLASFVYATTYTVQQLKGDRAVIGPKATGAVTAAINVADLTPA